MEKFQSLNENQKKVLSAIFKFIIANLNYSRISKSKLANCQTAVSKLNDLLPTEQKVSKELVLQILKKECEPTDAQVAIVAYGFLIVLLPEQFSRQNWTVEGFVTFVFSDLLEEEGAPSAEELTAITKILLDIK